MNYLSRDVYKRQSQGFQHFNEPARRIKHAVQLSLGADERFQYLIAPAKRPSPRKGLGRSMAKIFKIRFCHARWRMRLKGQKDGRASILTRCV